MNIMRLDRIFLVTLLVTVVALGLYFATLPTFTVMIMNGQEAVYFDDVFGYVGGSLHGNGYYIRIYTKSWPFVRFFELGDDEWLVIGR